MSTSCCSSEATAQASAPVSTTARRGVGQSEDSSSPHRISDSGCATVGAARRIRPKVETATKGAGRRRRTATATKGLGRRRRGGALALPRCGAFLALPRAVDNQNPASAETRTPESSRRRLEEGCRTMLLESSPGPSPSSREIDDTASVSRVVFARGKSWFYSTPRTSFF